MLNAANCNYISANWSANSTRKVRRCIKRASEGGYKRVGCIVCDAESIWHVPQRRNCIMVDRNFASRTQVYAQREYR